MALVTNSLNILNEEDKEALDLPRISEDEKSNATRKLYIESYGCQMNFADSEIVASILRENDFATTSKIEEAELILLNTCAIRENAEQKVRNRLQHLVPFKNKRKNVKIGILGCMAERLKTKLLEEEKIVDMVVGPDSYRDLPNLISEVEDGHKAVNVFLSREETYADITPIRLNSNGVTAMISIMRGCDNMCSFCVVPYTRGRERSRDAHSIVKEATDLFNQGYKEVTLLGQNVDSYKYIPTAPPAPDGGAKTIKDSSYWKKADPFTYGLLKDFSLKMRNIPTKTEEILWDVLSGKKLEGYKFRRQYIVGQYITDFICLKENLIIEIDGSIHQLPENKASDKERTNWLENEGYKVIRFTNNEVYNDIDKVIDKIVLELKTPAKIENNVPIAPPSGAGGAVITFANLLEMVAQVSPDLRVRFSTSHPKDITDDVLYTIKKYDNVCNYIHLPAQSGSSRILELMNRTYDREWYINRIDRIREVLGEECGISQDMIAGFCTETEEDHQETLSLLDYVKYDYGYMFSYSERPNTPAAKKLTDDVPEDVKSRRLAEIIARQREHSLERNQLCVGKTYKVLVEGFSKRSQEQLSGKNDQNKIVVFPKENFKLGDYVNVLITECSSGTLIGKAVM